MKMRLTFKDPDVLADARDHILYTTKKQLMQELKLTEAGADAESEERYKKMDKLVGQYMEYGEYITVEFDDEAGTVRVVPKNE